MGDKNSEVMEYVEYMEYTEGKLAVLFMSPCLQVSMSPCLHVSPSSLLQRGIIFSPPK